MSYDRWKTTDPRDGEPDKSSLGDHVDKLLHEFNAKIWDDAADALLEAIPRYSTVSAEVAMRRMAAVFRAVAKENRKP